MTELLVLGGNLITLRLAATVFGTIGFGEYSVAKRAMSILAFPLLMGLGISIPRYVALSQAKPESRRPGPVLYFLCGLLVSLPLVLSSCILALQMPDLFTRMFFGIERYQGFALPIVLATVGLYMQNLVYGYFRGRLEMRLANLFHLVTLAITPPVAILMSGATASRSVAILGVGWIASSLAFCIWILSKIRLEEVNIHLVRAGARDLLVYGLPRVPGEFALFGLFAIPTFAVSRRSGVEAAGFFSYGVWLLQFFGGLFATLGILLLPYVTRLRAQERWLDIQRIVSRVLLASVGIAAMMALMLQLLIPIITSLLVGSSYLPAVDPSRWLILGAIPYVVYLVLRNPIDAIDPWPHNSVNLGITVAILTGLVWFGYLFAPAQFHMFVALSLLSVLSLASWRRSLHTGAQGFEQG